MQQIQACGSRDPALNRCPYLIRPVSVGRPAGACFPHSYLRNLKPEGILKSDEGSGARTNTTEYLDSMSTHYTVSSYFQNLQVQRLNHGVHIIHIHFKTHPQLVRRESVSFQCKGKLSAWKAMGQGVFFLL